ncbi:glycosylphosphatidylinositol anchor attachment 1 protein [Diachasma alloeum]|uniref:glycosylphosphatidylinositol anchor attachment 1 protein n=1 Tax=Diachasma alloeum TaxID=454923 RepID=UPI00073838A7|nr:glycosylphosphatidylinositol anchor attachment 1 protein [Diachasma alloeum]
MGLLTDPRAGNAEMIKLLLRWERALCFFIYLGGVVWMAMLASPMFNDGTYFSENALLPGLVTKESNLEHTARQYHRELVDEMKRYPDNMPYAWILAKFNQLHLDVYTHNFTLNYPFTGHQFTGQNVYGIVRAPRAASTEAIVVSVPFRAANSVHPTTAPSIALLLAFAKFCRKQKYWAKDIIFLVTEHEQLGMQAWLDAYHGVVSGQADVLNAGDLDGRAGSIQAAINLEMHAMKVASIDVKIEGLNGQLPNLDLVNLAQNAIKKEMVRGTFQKRFDMSNKFPQFKKWSHHFHTLASMVLTQATGVPTGNHGLFHRYGIEAITLEGMEKTDRGAEVNFDRIGRIVESMVRSLNNLLERFHQSFFFYLLAATDRYISIGLYMPALVAIIGCLFIKAFCMWLKHQQSTGNTPGDSSTESEAFEIGYIASELLWSHIFGVAVMNSPKLFASLGSQYLQLEAENSVYYGSACITVLTLSRFFFMKRRSRQENVSLICIIALVELATGLMSIAMHNASLALLAGMLYVPIVLLIAPRSDPSGSRGFLYIFWTLLHPFVTASLVVAGYTYFHFSEESFGSLIARSFDATKKALLFSIIDSMIYGNWLFNVTATVILPIWLLLSNVIANEAVTD